MSPAQPVIVMQGIVKRYSIGKPNELEILHGIDLQVEPGEFVAIVGESRRLGIKNWQKFATARSASSFRPSI